ncbi:MAG: 50S ribosomal protein L6 [Candidatus Omnitrophica bacterium]|nr:50S ribosomal protein L6 [Candidatus Omnitrophota bacterium]MBU4487542.1 50S ribosomal protein L6 [Candidatus Omnitrophota bacterium]MCG2705782.1 50S ribosomal protein L6 [Candidatus Omnitrophota bacterium]
MARLGKKPIDIPGNVKVNIDKGVVLIEGPKGKLEHKIPSPIAVKVENNQVKVECPSDLKPDMSLHGLTRTLINNMIKGVVDGYQKELEIRGVGYKAQIVGRSLSVALGFSHLIEYPIPEGVIVETPKPTQIVIKGIDKVKVGKVAAELRAYYKPEPYKGKGIRYVNEFVKHKAGKTVA